MIWECWGFENEAKHISKHSDACARTVETKLLQQLLDILSMITKKQTLTSTKRTRLLKKHKQTKRKK